VSCAYNFILVYDEVSYVRQNNIEDIGFLDPAVMNEMTLAKPKTVSYMLLDLRALDTKRSILLTDNCF
jgi:hypothetical protein